MDIVRENIDFKRGQSPKKSMNIGKYRRIENPTADDIFNLEEGDYLVESDDYPPYSIITIEKSYSDYHKGVYFNMYQYKWKDDASEVNKDQLIDTSDNKEDIDAYIRIYGIISIQRINKE